MPARDHVIVRRQQPSQRRLQTENAKDIAGQVLTEQLLRLLAGSESGILPVAQPDNHQVSLIAHGLAVSAKGWIIKIIAVVRTAIAVEKIRDRQKVEPFRFSDRQLTE